MSSDMTPIRQFVEWSVTPVAYSMDGASAALGLSSRRIQRAVAQGDLTPHDRGKKPLFLRDDLIAWVESLPTSKP